MFEEIFTKDLLVTKPIDRFEHEYAFLSNFFYVPVIYEDIEYLTSEHAYQAAKCAKDIERKAIEIVHEPGKAKFIGNHCEIRKDWEEVKEDIMLEILKDKFSPGSDMAKRLLETGNREIIEGNWWHDNFWGDCYCHKCQNVPGQNRLGELLQQIRNDLKHEQI